MLLEFCLVSLLFTSATLDKFRRQCWLLMEVVD
jgi:hypothetical protein